MSFEAEVPDFKDLRKAVDSIDDTRNSVLCKMAYLTASRVSELIRKVTPYDRQHNQTKPYGVHQVWKLVDINSSLKEKNAKNKALLIKSAVAKRSNKNLTFKVIALPCDPLYEPWTVDLLKWISKHGTLSFGLTRHRVRQILIENLGTFMSKSSRRLNPLRHWRLSHLVELYGFDSFDLTIYAGWTLKTGTQGSSMLDSYVHLDWRHYFKKLLRPIDTLV